MSLKSVAAGPQYEVLYNPEYKAQRLVHAHLKTIMISGKRNHILLNALTGEYFEIDEVAASVWGLLDGTHTIEQIHQELIKKQVELRLTDVREVLLSFAEVGALLAAEPEKTAKGRINVVSAFQVNLQLLRDSSVSLAPLHNFLNGLLRRRFLIVAVLIVAAAFALYSGTFFQVLSKRENLQILGSTLLGFLFYNFVVLFPEYALHEVAHGVACLHYGGKPGAIGTGIFYFSPFFYCDTSDAWRLGRWERIMVSMSGPIVSLLVGATFVFILTILPEGFLKTTLTASTFFVFYGIAINFSPMIETDGYYILMDVLNVPNLRDESFHYVSQQVRRLLGRKEARPMRLPGRTKYIFLGFSVLAAVWLAFFAYATSQITLYLAQDAYGAAIRLLQSLFILRTLDATVIGVSVVLIGYFGMILVGYSLLAKSAVKKLVSKKLTLHSVYDKRLAVFLQLPSKTPQLYVDQLLRRLKPVCSRLTRRFEITWSPPTIKAVLRLGGEMETMEDTKREMLQTEKEFRTVYERFLSENEASLEGYIGAFSPEKLKVTSLMVDLAHQIQGAGQSDAESAVSQFLSRQRRTIIYLLNSVAGTIWTIELAPEEYKTFQRTLLPSLMVEDLTLTDLYDDVEEFKKVTILGIDSLAKLAAQIDREMTEDRKQSERFQATGFIEPIKSRIIFAGRTERVEESLPTLGSIFLTQTWSGYFDDALKNAHLNLTTLKKVIASRTLGKRALESFRESEIVISYENLARWRSVAESVGKSIGHLEARYNEIRNYAAQIGSLIDPTDDTFDVALYKAALDLNSENLKNIERRLTQFRDDFEHVNKEFERLRLLLEDKYEEKRRLYIAQRRKLRWLYVPVLLASIAGSLLLWQSLGILSFFVPPFFHGVYALFYYRMWRRFNGVSRFQSPDFNSLQMLILAGVQAVYSVVMHSDILS